MVRLIRFCLLVVALALAGALAAATAIRAQEERAEALTRLLPKPTGEWSSTGAKTKIVADGPTKGTIVFQVYQRGPRTVIVRFTENPPELIRRILAQPAIYNYKRDKIDGRDVVVKDEASAGTVLSQRNNILVSVDWSGDADRDDAVRFFKVIDFDALDGLK